MKNQIKNVVRQLKEHGYKQTTIDIVTNEAILYGLEKELKEVKKGNK